MQIFFPWNLAYYCFCKSLHAQCILYIAQIKVFSKKYFKVPLHSLWDSGMGELPIWIANSRFRAMAFRGVEYPRPRLFFVASTHRNP